MAEGGSGEPEDTERTLPEGLPHSYHPCHRAGPRMQLSSCGVWSDLGRGLTILTGSLWGLQNGCLSDQKDKEGPEEA